MVLLVSDESVHVSEVSSTLGQQFCGHRLYSVPYLGSWFMTVWSLILLSARTMRIFPYGSLCMIVVEIWAGESNVWRAWGPCLRWTHLSLAMFYCIKQVQTNGVRKYIPLSVGGAAKSPCSGRGHGMAVNSVMTAVCLPDSYWEAY